MSKPDITRASKTMAFLLRHRPDVGDLTLDEHGWVEIEPLAEAVSRLTRSTVSPAFLTEIIHHSAVRRFEVDQGMVRALPKEQVPLKARRVIPPDILYHATTSDRVAAIIRNGCLDPGFSGHVYYSANESKAWRTAHRLKGQGRASVLVIDACRARRRGVYFLLDRSTGLYLSGKIPCRDIFNLKSGFGLQISAGGFPVIQDEKGKYMVALVRVTRRSGVTWEVAKGKLEPGEAPEDAAIREVGEEMGIDVPMTVDCHLADIKFGYLTPDGRPLLKTIHLYLLTPSRHFHEFQPAGSEGILEVRWFSLNEAVRAVTHSSLIPAMQRLREILSARERANDWTPQHHQSP